MVNALAINIKNLYWKVLDKTNYQTSKEALESKEFSKNSVIKVGEVDWYITT
ncbi:MAG: hypothetical protein ACK5MK_14660 [Dysgonomonas sp.]